MSVDASKPEYELRQLITAWADSIVQSAKQLMLDNKAYLIGVSGLPWYRPDGDVWVDESWWINAARSRYERIKNLSNRMPIDELTILVRNFPSEYTEEALSRIDRWYKESAHDPENWWNLAMMVYPEHPMFREFLYEDTANYSEQAILASLGYEDVTSELRGSLLWGYEHQDWYQVSDILSSSFSIGGLPVIRRIVSDDELSDIRQAFTILANKDLPNDYSMSEPELINEYFGQIDCIGIAVSLGWQDVIDSLSENSSYLEKIGLYDFRDLLWWSLTEKRQLVQNLIIKATPFTPRPRKLLQSQFESGAMVRAIAWRRATSLDISFASRT